MSPAFDVEASQHFTFSRAITYRHYRHPFIKRFYDGIS